MTRAAPFVRAGRGAVAGRFVRVGPRWVPLADVHEARALSGAEADRWRRAAGRRPLRPCLGAVLVRAATSEGAATIWVVTTRDAGRLARAVRGAALRAYARGPWKAVVCRGDDGHAAPVSARVVVGVCELSYVRAAWRWHRRAWRGAPWLGRWSPGPPGRRRAIVVATPGGARLVPARPVGAAWTALNAGRGHGS